MREIKFRAWSKEGGFMLGVGEIDFECKCFRPYHCSLNMNFDDSILMQFIDCKDKNGKEIYEGDIVKNERNEVGIIVFSQGRFVSEYIPPHDWDPMEPIDGLLEKQEVIGNIHHDPELLEQNT